MQLLQKDAHSFLSGLAKDSVNLIVTSPPYFIGKEYDTSSEIDDFLSLHETICTELVRSLKPGGSLCWQVGSHVRDNVVVPLDALVYNVFSKHKELKLRNRIVWTFGHGAHCGRRFSGRHETILWFTKGDDYLFDLDAVRVPQKYPGKRHYKGAKKGEYSGNPLGKNPGDVWEIPNVKAGHVEKTNHPCQFPVALVQRLIKSLCPMNGIVIDPFMGSGTSAVAAQLEQRQFAGCDIDADYVKIARSRVRQLGHGKLKIRPFNQPIHIPSERDSVAMRPAEWANERISAI